MISIFRLVLVLCLSLSFFNSVSASFNSVTGLTLDCSSSSGNAVLNFRPGAPDGDYSFDVDMTGDFSEYIKLGSGSFGSSAHFDFNIPSDEGGYNIPITLDAATIMALEGFGGGSVGISISPGDSLTETTGFGSASGTITIGTDGCVAEPVETECDAEFTTNGLQPVGAALQDDNHFKNHTKLTSNSIVGFGESVIYSVSAEDAKELPRDRETLVLARNPNYTDTSDLTEITFTGTTKYSKMKSVKLDITVSDPSGEVLSYKHPQVLKGPFGLPCGEEQNFTVTFTLDKVLKRRPTPSTFQLKFLGAGDIQGDVKIVGEDSAIMSTTTNFEITETEMGTMGILPVGNPASPNVFAIKRKITRDAKMIANSLSKQLADYFPLPTADVDFQMLDFLTIRPTDVSGITNGTQLKAAINTNLQKTRKQISLASDKLQAQGDIEVVVSVFDTDTYSRIDDGSAAAFAYVGSPTAPGDVFIRGESIKKKLQFSTITTRVEDAVHEIAHSYGFVGEGKTTCPPVIHNVNSTFADNCRITRYGRVSSSCKLNQNHIMGPTVPSRVLMTQCSFDHLTDTFAEIATNNNVNQLTRASFITGSTESLLIHLDISTNGSQASFDKIYDSENSADEFLGAATDTSWYLDLKTSSNTSLEKLYFEFDADLQVPELEDQDSFIQSFNVPLLDGLAKISLVDVNGVILTTKTLSDFVPTVTILDTEFSRGSKKKGASLTLNWEVDDTSGDDIYSTVLVGSSEDLLLPHGDAFEITDTSATLEGLDNSIKFVQVISTNGSRSGSSEIIEL